MLICSMMLICILFVFRIIPVVNFPFMFVVPAVPPLVCRINECLRVFGRRRVTERFFAELSENNQKLLVERAVTLYDGRAFRKEPDDSDILVCKECGSRQ